MDAMFGGFKESPAPNKQVLINKSSTPEMEKLPIYNNNNNNRGADEIIDSFDWGDDM